MSGISESSNEQQLDVEQSLQSVRSEKLNHETHTHTKNDSFLLSNNESLAEMNCEDEDMPKKRKRETPIDVEQEDCKEESSPSIKIHKATEFNDAETKTASEKAFSPSSSSSSSSDVIKPLTHLCLSLLSSTYQEQPPSTIQIQNDVSTPLTPTTEANSVSVLSPSTEQTTGNGSSNKNIVSPCEPSKNLSSTPPTPTISEDPSLDQKTISPSPTTPIPSESKSFDTTTASLSSVSDESSSSSKTSDYSSDTTTTTTASSSASSKECLPSPIPYTETPSRSEDTPTSSKTFSSESDTTKPSPITFPNLTSTSSPNNTNTNNNFKSNLINEFNEVAEFSNLDECLLEIRRLRKENEEIKQRSTIELEMLRTQLALAQKENENNVNSANANANNKNNNNNNNNFHQSSESVTSTANKLPTGVSWFKRSQNARAECMRTLENESLGIDHLVNELASINRTLSLQLTKMKSSLG